MDAKLAEKLAEGLHYLTFSEDMNGYTMDVEELRDLILDIANENQEGNMETKYFNDYDKAKAYAKKHNLKECEYGDTGYMQGDQPLSYVAYNKSGDRFDEWEVECYYGWARNYGDDNATHRLKPCKGDKALIKSIYGVEV